MDECVVDANVWSHSQNPSVDVFDDAVQFVTDFGAASVVLCVDEGFSLVEEENRSVIGREYLDQLKPGSVAFQLIAALAASGRVRFVAGKVARADRDRIRRLVFKNTRDQHYLRVALNTTTQILVSHDFYDMPESVRSDLRKRPGIDVIDARTCCARLAA